MVKYLKNNVERVHRLAERVLRKAHRDHEQKIYEENKEEIFKNLLRMNQESSGDGCGCNSCLRGSVDAYNNSLDSIDEEIAYLNGHERMATHLIGNVIKVITQWEKDGLDSYE